MKRPVALFTAALLSCSLLASCGSKPATQSASSAASSAASAVSEAAESAASESEAAESEAAESEVTESAASESEAAESEVTESAASESEAAESEVTESAASESEAAESEVTESAASESEAAESEAAESKAAESEVTESAASESEAAESEAAESEVTESAASESEAAESEVTESAASESEAAESEAAESEAAESEAAESAASESETAESEAAESEVTESAAAESEAAEAADDDKAAADEAAALIDAIYVQQRTDETDDQIAAAKDAWDALTDEQKELVEGEFADPDYFGRDTGDASADDPLNGDEIGENEILVVSFGTSFNDSRATDIKGIEDAIAAANPDWAVRRAFTAQIIINHVQARDGEVIDNVDQALQRAVDNGVKNLVVQPTHLMHGAEYDELVGVLEGYKDSFDSVVVAEPLLGEVGADAAAINEDKAAVAEAVTAAAVEEAGYDSLEAAKEDGTAFVFIGHGTSHVANVSYDQMQTQMGELGYDNVFVGTVEGEPEDTACEAVIAAVKDAGYKKVVLRPLMVVAGDHANNDMADPEDEESWISQFQAAGAFDSVDVQIAGLGRIGAVQDLYVAHTKAAMESAEGGEEAAAEETEAATSEVSESAAAESEAAESEAAESEAPAAEAAEDDQAVADEAAALIDAIYVQERTDETDDQIAAAKAAWDAMTDEQKELVEGEFADPDYFGRDTGDASADDPLNGDEIGENEILVVSFGTSFNDSRATDIKGIEDAIAAAYPDWAVRRAFTAQIIINHVQARDGEAIDNVDQALQRAVDNGVKNLVVQPTHLMHGAEYDELVGVLEGYKDSFDSVVVAEPLLGEVGADAAAINEDKAAVAEAVTAAAVEEAGYDSLEAAKEDGTAFVFIGHGTSHVANVSYDQMQTQMGELGYDNVFVGTVEGEPEDTACEAVIAAVKDAGYKKVVLRPLMVVAGDHANNDMADPEDEESWISQFQAAGAFDSVDVQIAGLGRIGAVQDLYVAHTKAAMESAEGGEEAAAEETEAATSEVSESAAAESEAAESEAAESEAPAAEGDQAVADEAAALIDAIYVQERTDETDDQIAAAKAAWDALTDEQKELVEGEFADPDYFGRDTGDASADDPLNGDEIGENEILVVSFGTSFNDSRATDIKGIEDAIAAAYPDWAVRRAFTAQIIINHVQARDGEAIDNVDQALQRAIDNGVKNLVVQPTHLMHGAEYDELVAALTDCAENFDFVVVAEPLLGEVGADAAAINEDKAAVAEAVTAAAVEEAGYDSLEAAKEDGTAFVFIGHGTSHVANVSYDQMQTQMGELGYDNVFIGTVEGEPEDTACEEVIAAVKDAGYTKVVLRPLMVVAGDHANNDMADPEDEESWISQFEAAGAFDSIETQIAGLGRIAEIQDLYVAHTKEAVDIVEGEVPAEDTEAASEAAEEAEAASEAAEETEAVSEAAEETAAAAADADGAVLEDGVYTAEFNTDSSMFKVNEACEGKGTLTVQDGEMTIHVSLVSDKIVNLFPGTAEEAQAEGAELLQPTTDEVTYSDGMTEEVYGFDIPVPALDEEFDCALIGTKGNWYDHKVSVSNPEPLTEE